MNDDIGLWHINEKEKQSKILKKSEVQMVCVHVKEEKYIEWIDKIHDYEII